MNLEHQDGKTEPASKATILDCVLDKGSLGDPNKDLQSISKEEVIGE